MLHNQRCNSETIPSVPVKTISADLATFNLGILSASLAMSVCRLILLMSGRYVKSEFPCSLWLDALKELLT